MKKQELKIEGMHCVSCERAVKGALEKVPGVRRAEVSFAATSAKVECEDDVNDQSLIHAVHKSGYSAHLVGGDDEEEITRSEEKRFNKQLLLVVFSALLTLPLILDMLFHWLGMPGLIPLWMQFALATVVQFAFGWPFYVGSYYALKSWTGNMDLLIGLGTSAAYFYSAAIFLFGLDRSVYFESSASIVTLILLGRLLEARTRKRASGAIRELLKLQPKMASVQRDGQWQQVPIKDMQVGDLFLVKPGERVPIDGEVVKGESYVDESMLTGESRSVYKEVGAKIYGGTQNGQGAVQAKAVSVGQETALGQIIRLVQEAQSSRAPIQNLADRISAVFVPVVLGISVLTFFGWWGFTFDFKEALINSVAVLVIACPCALGMATPTVIMVASGLGARLGILVKNAEALELAQKLERVAIDKTGTLTEGKPKVTDIIPDDKEVRRIAASLEALSEHPLALAIANSHSGPKADVSRFEALSGKGAKGEIEGKPYRIGSLKWMEEEGVELDRSITDPLEGQGKTVVCLASGKKALGFFAVTDPLRASTKEGVQMLKEQKIEVVMLTGDHQKTAQVIAQEAGIDTFEAEILPEQKSLALKKLKHEGKMVGMVGDGINDAPALAASDVGFAMRSGTDIATQASDVTLMKNDLRDVAIAIDLSKVTFRKVRQNLFFAFIYNILGIPLAAFGLLNPVFAGAAMALSSLCVVSNALLLNRWKPKSNRHVSSKKSAL